MSLSGILTPDILANGSKAIGAEIGTQVGIALFEQLKANLFGEDFIEADKSNEGNGMRAALAAFVAQIIILEQNLDGLTGEKSESLKETIKQRFVTNGPFKDLNSFFNGSSTGNVLDKEKYGKWMDTVTSRIQNASKRLDKNDLAIEQIQGSLVDFIKQIVGESLAQFGELFGDGNAIIIYISMIETLLHFIEKLNNIKSKEQAEIYITALVNITKGLDFFVQSINTNLLIGSSKKETVQNQLAAISEKITQFINDIKTPLMVYVNRIPITENLKQTGIETQNAGDHLSQLAVYFLNSASKLDGVTSVKEGTLTENDVNVRDAKLGLYTLAATLGNSSSDLTTVLESPEKSNPYKERLKQIRDRKEDAKVLEFYSLLTEVLPAIKKRKDIKLILEKRKAQYIALAANKEASFPVLGRAIMKIDRNKKEARLSDNDQPIELNENNLEATYKTLTANNPEKAAELEWQFIQGLIEVIDISKKLSQFCKAMETFILIVGKIGMHNNQSLLQLYKDIFDKLTQKLQDYSTFLKQHEDIFNKNTKTKGHLKQKMLDLFTSVSTDFNKANTGLEKLKSTFVLLQDKDVVMTEAKEGKEALISTTINLLTSAGISMDDKDMKVLNAISFEQRTSERKPTTEPLLKCHMLQGQYRCPSPPDKITPEAREQDYLMYVTGICKRVNVRPIIVKMTFYNSDKLDTQRTDIFVYDNKGKLNKLKDATPFKNYTMANDYVLHTFNQPKDGDPIFGVYVKSHDNLDAVIAIDSHGLSQDQLNAIKPFISSDPNIVEEVRKEQEVVEVKSASGDRLKALMEAAEEIINLQNEQLGELKKLEEANKKALEQKDIEKQAALDKLKNELNEEYSKKITETANKAEEEKVRLTQELEVSKKNVEARTSELNNYIEATKKSALEIRESTEVMVKNMILYLKSSSFCLSGHNIVFGIDNLKEEEIRRDLYRDNITLSYDATKKAYICYYWELQIQNGYSAHELRSVLITDAHLNDNIRKAHDEKINNNVVITEALGGNLAGLIFRKLSDQSPHMSFYWKDELNLLEVSTITTFFSSIRSSIKNQIDDVTKHAVKVDNALSSLDKNIVSLQAELNNLEKAIKEYQQAVDDKIASLTKLNEALKLQLTETQKQLKDALNTVEALKVQLEKSKSDPAKEEQKQKEEERKKIEKDQQEAQQKKMEEQLIINMAEMTKRAELLEKELNEAQNAAAQKLEESQRRSIEHLSIREKFIVPTINKSKERNISIFGSYKPDEKTNCLLDLAEHMNKNCCRLTNEEFQDSMKRFIAVAMQKRKNRSLSWWRKDKTRVGETIVDLLLADLKENKQEESLLYKLFVNGGERKTIPTTYGAIALAVAEDLQLTYSNTDERFQFFGNLVTKTQGKKGNKKVVLMHDLVTVHRVGEAHKKK